MRVIGCLAEGLGLRGTARVFEIDPNTVLQWLAEATEQLNAFSAYFLNELQITQVQLDELYAVLSAVRDGEVSEAEAIERLSRSPHWVWTAIDPKSKLLLSIRVGPRTLAMAQAILHQIGLCRKVAFETICAMVSPADLRCTEIAGCKFSREHTRLCFALWRSCTKDESVLVEKCAIGWGSDDDEMRMSLGSFIRAIAGFTRGLCLHFISIFQQVAAIRKTCNQLISKSHISISSAAIGNITVRLGLLLRIFVCPTPAPFNLTDFRRIMHPVAEETGVP